MPTKSPKKQNKKPVLAAKSATGASKSTKTVKSATKPMKSAEKASKTPNAKLASAKSSKTSQQPKEGKLAKAIPARAKKPVEKTDEGSLKADKASKKSRSVRPKILEWQADEKVERVSSSARGGAAEKYSKLIAKWQSLFNKSKNIKTEPYDMRRSYERQTAISHKILGWGFILDNKNDRLEVLFKDGIKYLISNYK